MSVNIAINECIDASCAEYVQLCPWYSCPRSSARPVPGVPDAGGLRGDTLLLSSLDTSRRADCTRSSRGVAEAATEEELKKSEEGR